MGNEYYINMILRRIEKVTKDIKNAFNKIHAWNLVGFGHGSQNDQATFSTATANYVLRIIVEHLIVNKSVEENEISEIVVGVIKKMEEQYSDILYDVAPNNDVYSLLLYLYVTTSQEFEKNLNDKNLEVSIWTGLTFNYVQVIGITKEKSHLIDIDDFNYLIETISSAFSKSFFSPNL